MDVCRRDLVPFALLPMVCLATVCLTTVAAAQPVKTTNFVVHAPSKQQAQQVAHYAEQYRIDLAKAWLGKTLPPWSSPCKVTVKPGTMGASGVTTFSISGGHVFNWDMTVNGPYERILDSVLPHEISHTIFASHFRRELPRWADEGAATLIEHEVERNRLSELFASERSRGRRYRLRKLFTIMEYPRSNRDTLLLYAQGYSLVDYLVMIGGKPRYLQFLQTAHEKDWDTAIRTHYAAKSIEAFEEKWYGWVMAGSPRKRLPEGTELASNTQPPRTAPPRTASVPGAVVRGQSPRQPRTPANGSFSAPAPRVLANGNGGRPAPAPKTRPIGRRDRSGLTLPLARVPNANRSLGLKLAP